MSISRRIFGLTPLRAAALSLLALASVANGGAALAAPHFQQFAALTSHSHLLYVADRAANTIDIYPAGVVNPKKIGDISQGVNEPYDVCVDQNGSVYVVNNGPALVTVYAKGHRYPDRTLSIDAKVARNIAVGPDGTIYVVTSRNNRYEIQEFDVGAQTPSRIIKIPYYFPYPLSVSGIAVDYETNKLFVNSGSFNAGGGFGITVYLPRRLHPYGSFYLTYGYPGGAIEINERNHILIGDDDSVLVAALPHPSEWQFRRIRTPRTFAGFLALDASSNFLYVVSYGGLSIYDFVNGTYYGTIAVSAGGVAVSPPATS